MYVMVKPVKREISFTDAAVILLCTVIANLAVQFLAAIIIAAGNGATGKSGFGGDYLQLITMLLLQLAFVAVPFIYYKNKYKGKGSAAALTYPVKKLNKRQLPSIALPIITVLGFVVPTLCYSMLLNKIGYESSGLNLNTPGKFVFGLIVTVFVAPAVEEFIFRGVLLSGLKSELTVLPACALSALAFMLMHMNPEQTVYQFALGFVCAYATVKSGNLIVAIITHAGSNLIALLLDTPAGKPLNFIISFFTQKAWTTAVSAVLLMAGAITAIYFICRFMSGVKVEQQNVEEESESPFKGVEGNSDTAESIESEAPSKSGMKKAGWLLYACACGLCLIMWIAVFIASV